MRRCRTGRALRNTLVSRFVSLCGLNLGVPHSSGMAVRVRRRKFIAEVSRIVENFNVSLERFSTIRFRRRHVGERGEEENQSKSTNYLARAQTDEMASALACIWLDRC
jgi:hypothetical protein